jgi:hypothetical protein
MKFLKTLMWVLVLPVTVHAQNSGFLPDYEGLEFGAGECGDKHVLAQGAEEKLKSYSRVMVDQPEIILANSSVYKGFKPSHAAQLAESLRGALILEFEADRVVDQPGDSVLFLRTALSDVHIQKKKRSLLTYTPAGMVAYGARNAVSDDLTKKMVLNSVTIEGEMLDSVSGEHLESIVLRRRGENCPGGAPVASWEELMLDLETMSARMACRIRNASLAESDQQDCEAM